ncbi:MAG TPA: hypothetical protein VG326_02765 [Tepidisphaeraceae bacterium]|jgi:hypothetical protein|nr:hypothetical protein [Tepidisphaeraceae bacterium]
MCCSTQTSPVVPPIRTNRSLDAKIASIRANLGGARDFILADAKDADMAAGLAAPGKNAVTGKVRSLAEYRDQMREVTRQGLVDIMLMSASTSEALTIREKLFDDSTVTPAVRANDTTDIHLMAGSSFAGEPSRPFRSATIEQIQAGKINPSDAERRIGSDLGLYSITPNNRLDFDYPTLEAYKQFRIEAESKGFRHFLEVFDPNACAGNCPADLGRYINDLIVRTLAGVPSTGRPVFLKIAYHGPRAMEELVAYDPTLIPGILGGSSGTTHDAFKLLQEAKKYGARAALFGRKINNSEHQLSFVQHLHLIANGRIDATEAVKAYHGELQKLNIKPYRALKDDLELTVTASSYAGTGTAVSMSGAAEKKPAPGKNEQPPARKYKVTESATPSAMKPASASAKGAGGEATKQKMTPASPASPTAANGFPKLENGSPDFKKMTPAQKVAFSRSRIQSDLSHLNGDGKK